MLYQLSYTRGSATNTGPNSPHGGGRIRTYVGQSPADLQSAAISHSATPPVTTHHIRHGTPRNVTRGSVRMQGIPLALELTKGLEPLTC